LLLDHFQFRFDLSDLDDLVVDQLVEIGHLLEEDVLGTTQGFGSRGPRAPR
jgi:hypothetical protein